ncbi:hypothetical protein ACIBBD_13880 [Streptomyces sp. NPDC051315]|uniref:LppU/SCO3897 family protein n=1 Tax=Streptomyces sp. NPDC051315 TaxID=3365650 RepID=UPI003796BEA2
MSTPPPSYQPPAGHPVYAPTPHGYPQPGAAPALVCQVCGAAPAVPVTVRGHQGMIVIMRNLRRQGVFCRTCGLAVFREMQANTMLLGWWSPLSVIITGAVLLMNLGARSALLRLPQPTTWGGRPPLDPGKPLMKRPAGMVALVPLTLLAALVVSAPVLMVVGLLSGDSDPKPLTVGTCARNDGSWSDQDLKAVTCDSTAAQLRVTQPGLEGCEDGEYMADLKYSEDGTTNLCLRPLDR